MQLRPITYRSEILAPLLTSIAAGECCSVIGASGVGKSNLVQHMLRPDVLQHYLGETALPLRFVTFDINMLAAWDAWGFFEGLIDALAGSVGISDGMLSRQIQAAHGRVLEMPGQAASALRQSADILHTCCAHTRLVILFDEFDALFTQLPAIVLRNLRGLRDRHKYQLMYITFSRQRLNDLRDEAEWDIIEPFVELLSLRQLGLGPLNPEDSAEEIARFAQRHRRMLPDKVRQTIVEQSGGHPALLRALAQEALDSSLNDWTIANLPSSVVRLECAKIWAQLLDEEQDGLLQLVQGVQTDHPALDMLMLKGLVRRMHDGTVAPFSPILTSYIKSIHIAQKPTDAPAVKLDPQKRQVMYYGRDISTQLSELEYQLLAYLWAHIGCLCPIEEVAAAVYPNDQRITDLAKQPDDLERLRTLTRRLRRRLESLAPGRPLPLRIYQRRGYQLMQFQANGPESAHMHQ